MNNSVFNKAKGMNGPAVPPLPAAAVESHECVPLLFRKKKKKTLRAREGRLSQPTCPSSTKMRPRESGASCAEPPQGTEHVCLFSGAGAPAQEEDWK